MFVYRSLALKQKLPYIDIFIVFTHIGEKSCKTSGQVKTCIQEIVIYSTYFTVNNLNNKVWIQFLKYIQITNWYAFLDSETKLLLIIITRYYIFLKYS